MVGGRTGCKQPASSTAILVDPWTRVFPIGAKALEIEVEYLLIMQDGFSGGNSRDRVYLGQDQTRQGEGGILIVSFLFDYEIVFKTYIFEFVCPPGDVVGAEGLFYLDRGLS